MCSHSKEKETGLHGLRNWICSCININKGKELRAYNKQGEELLKGPGPLASLTYLFLFDFQINRMPLDPYLTKRLPSRLKRPWGLSTHFKRELLYKYKKALTGQGRQLFNRRPRVGWHQDC